MSIRIGHASSSENGGKYGTKGDQTGREVVTRSYYVYNGGWSYVLRPTNDVADKIAVACERGCANNTIGYSQDTRNSLHNEAKKVGYDLSKIKTPCNCDCSSFMTVCAIAGGVKGLEYTGNAPTTSTMRSAFSKTGKFSVLTDSKYLTSDKYLRRGDILVSTGHHTVMALSNGELARKTVTEIAKDVLAGKYGNGAERKSRIESEGYSYAEVQAEVNRLLKPATPEHISQNGLDLIKRFESCKLTAYRLDGEILFTIGWGHHGSDVLPNMTISQERADELLRIDVQKFEKYVKQYATEFPLNQSMYDALLSYTFNRGQGGLMELCANCHTKQEMADGFIKYWGKATRYKDALIRRRKAERELFLS